MNDLGWPKAEYTTPLGLESWFTTTQDGASLVLGFVIEPLRGLESWFTTTQDGASLVLGFVIEPLRGSPEIKGPLASLRRSFRNPGRSLFRKAAFRSPGRSLPKKGLHFEVRGNLCPEGAVFRSPGQAKRRPGCGSHHKSQPQRGCITRRAQSEYQRLLRTYSGVEYEERYVWD